MLTPLELGVHQDICVLSCRAAFQPTSTKVLHGGILRGTSERRRFQIYRISVLILFQGEHLAAKKLRSELECKRLTCRFGSCVALLLRTGKERHQQSSSRRAPEIRICDSCSSASKNIYKCF